MKAKFRAFGFVSTLVVICAASLLAPRTTYAATKTGSDFPNQKCDRKETNGSTTTGQCSSVCKGLDVSTTKDVNTGNRTCQAARVAVGTWGVVAVTGNSSMQFLRFNDKGDFQACALTSKPDEIECRPMTIREVPAISNK